MCFVVFLQFCIGATVIDTNWRIAVAMCSMCMCSRVKPKTEPNNQLLQKYRLFVLFFLSSVFIFLLNTISAIFFAAIKAICVISLTEQREIIRKQLQSFYVWYLKCLCECECLCYIRYVRFNLKWSKTYIALLRKNVFPQMRFWTICICLLKLNLHLWSNAKHVCELIFDFYLWTFIQS